MSTHAVGSRFVLDRGLRAALDAAPVPRRRRREFAQLLSQTSNQERASLYALTRHGYTGTGAVLDLGAAGGGSTYCLAAGLLDTPVDSGRTDRRRSTDAAGDRPRVHAFDLFDGYSMQHFGPQLEHRRGVNDDVGLFQAQTRPVADAVVMHRVDLSREGWGAEVFREAEIVHIDAAKSRDLWNSILPTLLEGVIPGLTTWIFQDFERVELPWQVWTLAQLLDHGHVLGGAMVGTVYFRFDEPVPESVKTRLRADDVTIGEMVSGIERVIAHVGERHRHLFERPWSLDDVRTGLVAYAHHCVGDHERARAIFDEVSPAFMAAEPATDRDLWLASAHDRLDSADAEGAVEAAGRVVAVEPGHVEALMVLARARSAQGRSDEAAEAAGRVVAVEPGHVEALMVLARARSAQGRSDEAAEAAEKVIATDPAHTDALMLIAQIHHRDGDLGDALTAAHRRLAVDPGHAWALVLLVDVNLALRRFDDAAAAADRLEAVPVETTDEALADAIGRCIGEVRDPLAEPLNEVGRWLDEADRVASGDPSAGPDRAATLWFQGRRRLLAGGAAAAIERLGRLPDDGPPGALVDRAWAHLRLGDVDGAHADLTRVVGAGRPAPDAPGADIGLLAAVLTLVGRSPGPAVATTGTRRPPRSRADDGGVYRRVAVEGSDLHHVLSALDDALEQAADAAERVPPGHPAEYDAWVFRARMASARGQVREAARLFDGALGARLTPDALVDRAWEHLRAGDPVAASADLEAATSLTAGRDGAADPGVARIAHLVDLALANGPADAGGRPPDPRPA